MALDPVTGLASYVLVAKETTYGQAPSPFPGTVHQYLNFNSEDFDEDRENLASPRISTNKLPWTRVHRSARKVVGTLVFELPYSGAELIFEAAWGARHTATMQKINSPEVYTHWFTTDTELPSLTIEVGFEDRAMQIYGCVVRKLTFSVSSTGYTICKADIVGQRSEIFNVPGQVPERTPVFRDYRVVSSHHDPFIITWYTRGQSSEANEPDLISFEAVIENDIRLSYPLGSDLMKKPRPGGYRKCSGSLTGEFNDSDFDAFRWYNSALKGLWVQYARNGVKVPVKNAGGNGGDAEYEIEYRGAKLDLRGATPKITSEGRVILDVSFEGFFDVTGVGFGWEEADEPFTFRTQNDLNEDLLSVTER